MRDLEEYLRASPSLAGELETWRRVAAGPTPVVILGEPGTGRTRLARALHRSGPRADAPLVEVDPASLPAELVESELFGHRAGAFTGAQQDHAGRVERAQGGALLLDPLEELPLAVQPKLLRLVAEGRYTPLGGRDEDADVRFLSVASEGLPARVEGGAFRADLWYRLGVFPIHLPPLRQRREDLEPLIEAILSDLAGRLERSVPSLHPRAVTWMREHPWPGNLRQLRNVLERQWILEPDSPLDPPLPAGGEVPRPLAELEREAIRRALAYTGGHQTEAARLLGISRKSLWERRRRYGLP